MFLSNATENSLLYTDKMNETYWKLYYTAVPKKTKIQNKQTNKQKKTRGVEVILIQQRPRLYLCIRFILLVMFSN